MQMEAYGHRNYQKNNDGRGTNCRKHAHSKGNGNGAEDTITSRGSQVPKNKNVVGDDDDVKAKEAFPGYIHFRATRGQAADRHILAERMRREKISERMKMLQSLVPGCHKFLSTKLVSLDPMLSEFAVDNESNFQSFPELLRMAAAPHEQLVLGQPNKAAVAHLQHISCFDGTNTADADATLLSLLSLQDGGSSRMVIGEYGSSATSESSRVGWRSSFKPHLVTVTKLPLVDI
ncbi:hypothetical protein ABZP36_014528 [Zizania latifolia]